MKVDFNPSVNFRANSVNVEPNVQTAQPQVPDVQISQVSQKTSKTIGENVASVWKFFTVANQMANAALKGLFYGALTGVALLSGSWLFKSLPKAFSKEGATLWQTVRHPLKNISKSGKAIAGVGSGLVLAYHLIKGKLDSNQSTAVIDHKLKVGHRNV